MNPENTIKKVQKSGVFYEVATWGAIVVATIFVAVYFPYSAASNALIYVLIGATFASTFWYLRSRRLFILALQSAQEALAKNRELLKQRQTSELIMNHSSDGILILDDQKRIVSFSQGLEKMIGFKAKDLLGKVADQVLGFSGRAGTPSILDIILLPKEHNRHRYRLGSYVDNSLRTKNGGFIDTEIAYDSFKDPVKNRLMAIAVLRDVTYEQEVRKRDKEFVSMASHQIYTPLSMIRGFLSLLLDDKIGKLNPKQQLYSDKAYQASVRLVSLIASLLSTSRIEGERIQLAIKEYDLRESIEKIVEDYRHGGQLNNNRLELRLGSQKLNIEADQEKISQVVSNCLDNAIKYTFGGKILVELKSDHGQAIIKIIDNGMGIPQNEIDRIGTKFYRAQNVMKVDTKGTGLGMYIASYLLERHGGKIHFDSTEGRGTVVTIKIPIKSKVKHDN